MYLCTEYLKKDFEYTQCGRISFGKEAIVSCHTSLRQFFLHYNSDFSHICLKCLFFEFLSLAFSFLILSLDVAKNARKPFYLF